MYTIIIVDDEEYARNGLKNTVNWNKYSFKVVGVAENGKVAFDLISKFKPNVVLTDIMMPKMNGIELLKQTNARFPQIKFIMISAYDEFKFAQEAMKYGARGYLLKPLDEQELSELLNKVVQEIQNGQNITSAICNNPDIEDTSKTEEIIALAQKYVNENYDKKIALKDIAEYLYISPAYFSVIFKKLTGQNFVDYVNEVKIEKAKELLENSMYKVKEIAYRIGFEDYTYFCKVFKKIEGITPLEYRSNIIRRMNEEYV